ncbi:MAG: hypothetical protein JSW14_04185 [Candidatus Bathyarchaeum sp.]|nr:MAG: hypothetical protein JSW14_04185 [Candidatus Bathyarchaeum sp.]
MRAIITGKIKKVVLIQLNYERLKKSWLHVSLLVCFIAAVALLVFLDYFNIESITLFNERGFYFDYTWKGRLFLLFFVWLFVLESLVNLKLLEKDQKTRSRSHFKVLAIFLCAIIPIIYIFSVNFLGLDQTVINIGEVLRGDYWRAHSPYWELILEGDWPLVLEYLVFTISFLATILLAYGKAGLKAFSITLALIAGMGTIYLIDTLYPYGVFKPLQMLALPTAACAAALLEIMGYNFILAFSTGLESTPIIRINANGSLSSVSIAWPCAGVHSLFLYTLIILLLFRKSSMSSFRKLMYFIIGAIGTYSVNVLRIVSYFIVLVNEGKSAAQTFHDIYGELYSVLWIFLYILLITCIQKFRLVERTTHTLRYFLERVKSKV